MMINIDDPGPPQAVIQQVGRWRYSIWVSHGLTRWCGTYGTYVYGKERAEKKARRMLAQYIRIEERRKNKTVIS